MGSRRRHMAPDVSGSGILPKLLLRMARERQFRDVPRLLREQRGQRKAERIGEFAQRTGPLRGVVLPSKGREPLAPVRQRRHPPVFYRQVPRSSRDVDLSLCRLRPEVAWAHIDARRASVQGSSTTPQQELPCRSPSDRRDVVLFPSKDQARSEMWSG